MVTPTDAQTDSRQALTVAGRRQLGVHALQMGGAQTQPDSRPKHDSAEPSHPAAGVAWTTFTRYASVLLAAVSMSCVEEVCHPEGDEPQRYSGGLTNDSGTFYQSSSLDGPYLFFPSGRVYRLEHGLRTVPDDFNVHLSFGEFPLEDGSGIGKAAGNLALIDAVNDEYIEVRNDTCAEYFMHLTASSHFGSQADAGVESSSVDSTQSDGAAISTSNDAGE